MWRKKHSRPLSVAKADEVAPQAAALLSQGA
jgi:hypothetical protein